MRWGCPEDRLCLLAGKGDRMLIDQCVDTPDGKQDDPDDEEQRTKDGCGLNGHRFLCWFLAFCVAGHRSEDIHSILSQETTGHSSGRMGGRRRSVYPPRNTAENRRERR